MTSPDSGVREPNDSVLLSLTKSEAIVLFEFLSRYANNNRLEIHDQAEQRVLWNLCCDLERALAEPFQADYSAILGSARNAVRDQES